MLYMAKLGPDVITEEINIDEEDAGADPEGTAEACVSVLCQKQIKGGTLGFVTACILGNVSQPWLPIGIMIGEL